METLRERLIEVLLNSERPLTVDELAQILKVPRERKKMLYQELVHAAKTLMRKSGGSLQIVYEPPRCAKCGYVFGEMKRVRKPSKCPRCKSERILPPRFMVIRR